MKLSKACQPIINGVKKKVVLANIETGKWVSIPYSCWKIIKEVDENDILLDDIYDRAFDEEDRNYFEYLFGKLQEAELLVSDEDWEHTYRTDINQVYLNLTNRCNLACRHCCVDAKHVSDFLETDDLNTDTMKRLIDIIVDLNPSYIVLTGGEPMIRKDFIELLLYIRSKYSKFLSLSTNAILINKDNINILNTNIDKYDISIDGVDEESCASVRGRGVFKRVIDSVKLIKEHGTNEIFLSMMFGDYNQHLKKDFLKLCHELSVNPLMRAFEPMGRGADNWLEFERESKEIEVEEYTSEEIKIARADMHCFNCGAGKKEIMITAKGDIFPCGNLNSNEYCLGNILEIDNINTYFDKNFGNKECKVKGFTIFEESFPHKFERCKDCNVNLFCWSCISGIKNRFTNKKRFDEECREKKISLEQLIWGD